MGNQQQQRNSTQSSSTIIDWNGEDILPSDHHHVVKLWNRFDLLSPSDRSEVDDVDGYKDSYSPKDSEQIFKVDLLKEGYTKEEIKGFDYCNQQEEQTNKNNLKIANLNHHPLLGNNNRKICLRLKELFTEKELGPLVVKLDSLQFHSLEKEYPKQYRNCERALVKSKQIADTIWNRIKPMLKVSDMKDLRPYGFDTEGLWKPIGVNECLRISKYDIKGFFKPHMDSQFVVDDNRKSILTVLLYLHGDSHFGGSTDYYHCIEKNGTSLMLKKVLTTRCIAGDCILFNHEIYHSGEPVEIETKFVLRTEVIFQRVDTSNVSRADYKISTDYKKIRNLVEESERLEKEGNIEKSTDIYLEAQHLQMTIPTNACSSRSSFLESTLPSEVLSAIFGYLTPYEVCKNILYLNRNLNAAARDQYTWKQRYRDEWCDLSPSGFDYNSKIMKMEEELLINDTTDWFQLFVTRKNLDKDFCSLIIDPGPNYFRYALKSDTNMRVEVSYSGIGRHRHYFLPGRGLNNFFTGDSAGQYCYMYEPVDLFVYNSSLNTVVLSCFIEQIARNSLKLNLKEHPLLIAKPLTFKREEEENLKDILFGLGVPAIHIEYSYSLIALYYGISNFTIIDLLPTCITVAVIENGHPVLNSAYYSSNFLWDISSRREKDWPEYFIKSAIVKNGDDDIIDKKHETGESLYKEVMENINEAKLQEKPQNIIVRGEISQVSGLVRRLTKGISEKYPEKNFTITHDPENCIWDVLKGGKILSNLSDFREKCQKSVHYEQNCQVQYATLDKLI